MKFTTIILNDMQVAILLYLLDIWEQQATIEIYDFLDKDNDEGISEVDSEIESIRHALKDVEY